MPLVYLTRAETFSSAHRLHSNNLTDEENKAIYDKCNNKFGHGHNYTIKVTVKGQIDPITGMVCNMTSLKTALKEKVLDLVDHKNLDLEVPFFKDKPRFLL
ncbi:hypothetical protein BB559_004898 [Furculomyces boomerangus]|uniref:6-pyruvoyltetrahydropterin synthase n=1 Tax=Furculomyces boomerangus TaxID=61424 RepID=A0A2T9YC12_9FUNG|nr:hypothetical protein BB559_004898 [Furculomyces boomerangus]